MKYSLLKGVKHFEKDGEHQRAKYEELVKIRDESPWPLMIPSKAEKNGLLGNPEFVEYAGLLLPVACVVAGRLDGKYARTEGKKSNGARWAVYCQTCDGYFLKWTDRLKYAVTDPRLPCARCDKAHQIKLGNCRPEHKSYHKEIELEPPLRLKEYAESGQPQP